ncbi:MAG: hypothetical protein EBU66_16760 [Bacteroidetes bacterium]|nr:hypothetical protein [Bacteroidota bacterium]
MKGILFFLVLLGIIIVAWNAQSKEGFQDEQPPGALNIPLISPRYQTLTKGEVQDFAPPSATLLAPPPGQSASVNSQPAEDPALEKVPSGRIQSVYESILGFFKNEAPGLQKLGDPSVQLPLSTARSDKQRLKDEMDVLSRNPGLQSSLTSDDLDGIQANLAYLQNKWRMSTNSMSDSPMMEGFATQTHPPSDVTLSDLKDISVRIDVEILRLQNSGATDNTTTSRISTLQKMEQYFQDLITDINKGYQKLSDLTFQKTDIINLLPTITNVNSRIGDLFGGSRGGSRDGSNSLLNSLFPAYGSGDHDGAELAKKLFRKYEKQLLNNLSWDVSLHYTGKAEQDVANNYASAAQDFKLGVDSISSMLPSDTNSSAGTVSSGTINKTSDSKTSGSETSGSKTSGSLTLDTNSKYRGLMSSVIQSLTGATTADVSIHDTSETNKESKSSTPFDWKSRSNEICGQIKARGYNPYDFGCLERPDQMNRESFSWRGYARMICNRISTIYDPSVPTLCGCPPPTWPGWRQ